MTEDDVRRWAAVAARAADDKKASDTLVLEVGAVLAITDLFVITSGSNPRMVRTIADEVEQRVKDEGGPAPLRIEGLDELTWVLMDYGTFVVHIFSAEMRAFYQLERLWKDVPRLEWAPAG